MVMVRKKAMEVGTKGVKEDLFSSYQLGTLKLSHRIVLAPMTRCRATNAIPNESLEKYYTQRATPGGLLITEGTLISPVSKRYSKEIDNKEQGFIFLLSSYVPPHCPGIYTDQQVEAWKTIVDSVHAKGAFIFCQLWHVGQVFNQGTPISSTTTSESGTWSPDAPKILEVVELYRQATLNAIRAGFDGVEIHAADGYLIDQFLLNTMNDQSEINNGSSLEGITKFVMQVVQAVVGTIGADKVGVRISPPIDRFEGTDFNSLDLGVAIVVALNKIQSNIGSKLAYLHVTRPRLDQGVVDLPIDEAEGDARDQLLKNMRDAFEGTFMSSGGYTKDQGMEAVAHGEADLVAYGRAFLSNPDLVIRFKENAPMNKYVRATFYTNYPILGYIDYPSLGKETIMHC